MRFMLPALLLLGYQAILLAQDASKPWIVPGLALDEPRTATRPGYAIVGAKVNAKDTSKVALVWKVRATFADKDDEDNFQWEIRADKRSVQIGIPAGKGTVLVTATAAIDGELTPIAETRVDVNYAPKKANPPKAESPAKKKESAWVDEAKKPPVTEIRREDKGSGKVAHAWFVVDPLGGDPNVNALVGSVGLKNALRSAGVERHALDSRSPLVVEQGLAGPVRDKGGSGVMVLTDSEGRFKRAEKIPDTTEQVLRIVKGTP